MEVPVQKGERLWAGDGLAIYATDVPGMAIMEWEDPAVCEAAIHLNNLLKRHALAPNYLGRYDRRSILVRHLEPLNIKVAAEARPGDSSVTFLDSSGRPIAKHEVQRIDGVGKGRPEMIEDVAAHAVRSLRAHLTPHGVKRIRLNMTFGLAADGSCLLQVVNPLVCDLGSTKMEGLANLLGG